ncbi:DNA topoisomerase 3-alpha [Bienertia sinuspersici]
MKCQCGRDAILRIAKHGSNAGLKFYGCPLWL